MKHLEKFKIDYEIDDQRWSFYDFTQLKNLVEKIMLQLIQLDHSIKPFIDKIQQLHISIVFTNNQAMQKLNSKFRGKDKPTNVLSFPASDYYDLKINGRKIKMLSPVQNLGDIVLAYETIKDEASEQEKSLQDHFTHLLVHALLHLWGYEHINDQDAEEMERLEIKILKHFNIASPYHTQKSRELFRAIDE